jgi:hypothetical protein
MMHETAARQGCEGGNRHAVAALPWRICDGLGARSNYPTGGLGGVPDDPLHGGTRRG